MASLKFKVMFAQPLQLFAKLRERFAEWHWVNWLFVAVLPFAIAPLAGDLLGPSTSEWEYARDRCNLLVGGWGWKTGSKFNIERRNRDQVQLPPTIQDCKNTLALAANLPETAQARSYLLLGKAYFYDENYLLAVEHMSQARVIYLKHGLLTDVLNPSSDEGELDKYLAAAKSGKQLNITLKPI
ncbi:MAG: hypothetical protein V4805_10065 [Pseudomonadota bacterium]